MKPTKNKRLIFVLLIPTIVLLIPFIAMQFSDEVNWSLFDFVVAGILLFGTSLLCELAIRKISNLNFKIVACIVILIGLFLIWAELAVGVFGSPLAGS